MQKIWIVWAWNVAKKHIEALKELNIKVWIYDIIQEKSKKYANKYWINFFESLNELIEKNDIISICTPHHSHIWIIRKVIEKNKICICEKPLYLHSSELLKLENLDLKNLFVMFQNRFNNAIIESRKIINSGKIWEIYYIKWFTNWHRDDYYYSSSDWKGKKEKEWWIMYNQGIHNLDSVLFLLSISNINDINILNANKFKFRDFNIETEDYFSFLLNFKRIKYEYSLITYWNKWRSENSIILFWTKWTLKIWWNALNKIEYLNKNGEILENILFENI